MPVPYIDTEYAAFDYATHSAWSDYPPVAPAAPRFDGLFSKDYFETIPTPRAPAASPPSPRFALQMAKSAYNPSSEGFELYRDHGTNTLGILELHEGEIYVSFRGSTFRDEAGSFSLTNWRNALRDPPVFNQWAQARVHGGFSRAFDGIWPTMQQDLKTRPEFAGRPLHFVGHSKGGVLASVAALAAQRDPTLAPHLQSVTTFGMPAYGTSETYGAYEARGLSAMTTHYRGDIDIFAGRSRHHVFGALKGGTHRLASPTDTGDEMVVPGSGHHLRQYEEKLAGSYSELKDEQPPPDKSMHERWTDFKAGVRALFHK